MDRVFDWLSLALIVAIVLLFVRPRSQGPMLVEKIGNSVIGVFREVTGGGGW